MTQEDLDYGPSASYLNSQADIKSKVDRERNGADDNYQNLFGQVVDGKANTLGQHLKNNLLKVSGAIASVGKKNEGGLVAAPGGGAVGSSLGTAPRLQMAPP